MKDSLFEMLMHFFEKSLAQLKENHLTQPNQHENSLEENDSDKDLTNEGASIFVKSAQTNSMRVFTEDEKLKFTKASYQFLTRLLLWGIIAPETLELVMNQLLFSESRFVSLQETKWTIRNILAENLDAAQLAFLDLVLYQKEDQLPLH